MAASGSGKKLLVSVESKGQAEDIEDLLPRDAVELPEAIVNLITEYIPETETLFQLPKPFLFSGNECLLEKILFLAEYAGPLDKFDYLARKLIKNELDKGAKDAKEHVLLTKKLTIGKCQGTLIQCLVINMDQTIRDAKGVELDEGMAERFIKIIEELLPKKLEKVKEQARMAAPPEDEKAKLKRESNNSAEANRLFDAFIQGDQNVIKHAIERFKAFVKSIEINSMNDKGYLINNQYCVNLIHLIGECIDVLANRGGELTPINAQDQGRWYGKKADRFCFEIIGAFLQLEQWLPPRLKQILRLEDGLYSLFNEGKKPDRTSLDVSGDFFRGVGTNYLLGANSYYSDFGLFCGGRRRRDTFQNLLQAITAASRLYVTAVRPIHHTPSHCPIL